MKATPKAGKTQINNTMQSSPTYQVPTEELVDAAWKNYSLDAPRTPNPIPGYTRGLRRICIGIHFLMPIIKIIIGIKYLHKCPTNDWIPIYVLVGGVLQLVFIILLICQPLRHPLMVGIMGISVMVWMTIASFNTFVEWTPDFYPGGWRYCNRILFYFAFFISIAEYIILAVLLLLICTYLAYTKEEKDVAVTVTLTKSEMKDEEEIRDSDLSDVSDIEYFTEYSLKEKLSRMSIEERIHYLETIRKHLKSRRETELLTQGTIIVVVFVVLTYLLYYTL